jgi:MinD-like ATPase involved in chromosome partitioning or flagellar assembly/GTPase SAR1 family protein
MDIEWKIKSERKNWPSSWASVEVYPEELIINVENGHMPKEIISESLEFLHSILNDAFDSASQTIKFPLMDSQLCIVFEETDKGTSSRSSPLPLFKNSFYQERYNPESSDPNPLKIPVVAFHSYKGGVGRTLSLIALLHELIRQNKKFKILVVDADIEAPGLTLMAENYGFPSEDRISYADILSIIHNSETSVLFDKVVNDVARSMATSTITVPGTDVNTDQFFIPAYRFDYQLLDNFIHPETIISMPERSFIIQDFFSRLGEILKVDVVIVDLRAGFSELSAPFLFDPRVKRVFVTTTSKQSVMGIKNILDKIYSSSFSQKPEMNDDESVNMTVLLTMIPKDFDTDKLNGIAIDLLEAMPKKILSGAANKDHGEGDTINHDEDDTILSDMVIEAKFSDNLIHLENIDQIIESIKDSVSVLQAAETLAKRVVLPAGSGKEPVKTIDEKYRKEIIDRVHDIADKEITAEGLSGVKIMATGALEKLCRAYRDAIPKVVVLGAKGSGKTYIYKQLLDDLFWETFTGKILSEGKNSSPKFMVMPVLATKNRSAMGALLEKCFLNVKKELSIDTDIGALHKNEMVLQEANRGHVMQASKWLKTWNKIFLDSLSMEKYSTFHELDAGLAAAGKKIVFIIDGLEDIFNETINSENSREAIKSLCQDLVNQFSEYKNIGIIVFIRNDITKNSIQTNYEQFEKQYAGYALKWSQDEALRLAIWILAQIGFYKNRKNIIGDEKDIPKLSHSTLEDCLIPFWGLKLGRDGSNEAFSTRWIITALSDLNLQIQARDIIRFLSSATSNYTRDQYYHDRILLPADIRHAIPPCSEKKLKEIYSEMPNIKSILTKFEKADMEKKLPIKTEIMNSVLSVSERSQLEVQGFLTLEGNDYYIPEIIRHALGYKYAYGSRPRVLSLLQKR